MTLQITLYVVAALLILVGVAGTILPLLPGVPLVWAGMFLAAWVDGFTRIGAFTLILLGVLAALAMLLDFIAGLLGAKKVGASALALWGSLLGAVVGIFFGLPGLIFGPFVGAVGGELAAGRDVMRSTHVGLATWIGLLFGTLAKIALACTMLGIFMLALLLP